METNRIMLGVFLFSVLVLLDGVKAQSGCTTALVSLAPCLNFINGNSSTPSSTCCSQLATVVQSTPRCLCSVLNGGSPSLGIPINQTLALSLPNICKVKTPPVSQCNAANGPTSSVDSHAPAGSPVGAPVGSPVGSPTESPVGSPTESSNQIPNTSTPGASNVPSGFGSKTRPSTTGNTSNGINVKVPIHFVVFLFFVVFSSATIDRS